MSAARHVAVALLTTYALLLILSAWPDEARPRLFDLPSRASLALLGSVGLRGGVPVFEPPAARITRVSRNDCIRVRGLAPGAAPALLYPADGRCVTSGFRPRIPWIEQALRGLLVRGPTPLNQAVVGDFFCFGRGAPLGFGEGAPAPRFDEIEVLWTVPWFHIETGEEGVHNVVVYRWRCDPPGIVREVRNPSDAELEALP